MNKQERPIFKNTLEQVGAGFALDEEVTEDSVRAKLETEEQDLERLVARMRAMEAEIEVQDGLIRAQVDTQGVRAREVSDMVRTTGMYGAQAEEKVRRLRDELENILRPQQQGYLRRIALLKAKLREGGESAESEERTEVS